MRKEFVLLLFAVFLLVFGTFMAGTILTPYAKSLGATGISVGIVTGALYIVRLFMGTPIGRLADKKGVLPVLNYSLLLYPFVALAYWLARSIPTLIGARLLHGLASAMMLPMAMAYIGQVSPLGKEGHYMGIYNTVILIASALGPQTATIIADKYDKRATFLILFVLAFISLIIMTMLHKNNKVNKDKVIAQKNEKCKITSIELFRNGNLLALSSVYIALAVISSFIGFFFILFPPTKEINLVFTGSIISIYNLASGVVQIPLGRVTDKFNKRKLILFASLLATLELILFPLINSLWSMILLMVIFSITSAVLLSSSSALSTILGRNIGMGSVMGFLGTSNSVGMVFGSILLSLMPNWFGIDYMFYLSSGITLVCAIVFLSLWKQS